jgi:hypothetical protein
MTLEGPTDEEQAEIIRAMMAEDAETTGFLGRVEAARDAGRKPMAVEAAPPIPFRWHNEATRSGVAPDSIRGPMMGRPTVRYNAEYYRPTADGSGVEPAPYFVRSFRAGQDRPTRRWRRVAVWVGSALVRVGMGR